MDASGTGRRCRDQKSAQKEKKEVEEEVKTPKEFLPSVQCAMRGQGSRVKGALLSTFSVSGVGESHTMGAYELSAQQRQGGEDGGVGGLDPGGCKRGV